MKELPLKIIDLIAESEEEFHINNFKVIEDPTNLLNNIRDYFAICKFMKSRTKYNEAFSDRLNNLSSLLRKAKKIIKELLEIQKNLIFLMPVFSFKGMENFFEKESFQNFNKTKENHQKTLVDLNSVKNFNLLKILLKNTID